MNSLPPSTSRRAAASAIRPQSSAIGGPAAYFSTLASRPSTGSPIPAFSSSAINHQPSVLGRFAAFTLIELLVVIAIIAILAGLAFPAVNGAINSARKAQARNDVMQIVTAIKAFKAEYGRLPIRPDDFKTPNPNNEYADDPWYQTDNRKIIRVLLAEEPANTDPLLNPKNIVFLEAKVTRNKKGGVDLSDYTFYDPWGTPYAIKVDRDGSGKMEYYNNGKANIFGIAMAASAGPGIHEKKSPPFSFGDPFKSTDQNGNDDILSFK